MRAVLGRWVPLFSALLLMVPINSSEIIQLVVEPNPDDAFHDALIALYADGSRATLVQSHGSDLDLPFPEWEHTVEDIQDVTWSPSSHRIYFLSSKWVTSAAIFRYDLDRREVVFLIDGNGLELSAQGPDVLKIGRHMYRPEGGSYGAESTIDGDGHEIAPRVLFDE